MARSAPPPRRRRPGTAVSTSGDSGPSPLPRSLATARPYPTRGLLGAGQLLVDGLEHVGAPFVRGLVEPRHAQRLDRCAGQRALHLGVRERVIALPRLIHLDLRSRTVLSTRLGELS